MARKFIRYINLANIKAAFLHEQFFEHILKNKMHKDTIFVLYFPESSKKYNFDFK